MNELTHTEKEMLARAAGAWWTERLRRPEPHDNGSRDLGSILACAMADRARHPITEEQLAVFRKELEKRVLQEELREFFGAVSLYSDYEPSGLLREAAKAAGIRPGDFPYKTGLKIYSDGRVMVFTGYAQREIKRVENGAIDL